MTRNWTVIIRFGNQDEWDSTGVTCNNHETMGALVDASNARNFRIYTYAILENKPGVRRAYNLRELDSACDCEYCTNQKSIP